MLKIHTLKAEANSRLVGLRFAMMTLRLLEQWRSHLGIDHGSALIVMATLAITMEKFTRAEFGPGQRDIREEMRVGQLTKCNVRSIAAATGFNRETTRRKVRVLLTSGVLLSEGGLIRVSPDFTRSVRTPEMLRSLLETLAHTTNELLRDGTVGSHDQNGAQKT
jgi:hypothetical protein